MTKFEYDIYKNYDKKTTNTASGGMKFCDVLLIVFEVLKLCKVINWSWWWILSPFWIPLSLVVLYFIIIGIIYLIRKAKRKE